MNSSKGVSNLGHVGSGSFERHLLLVYSSSAHDMVSEQRNINYHFKSEIMSLLDSIERHPRTSKTICDTDTTIGNFEPHTNIEWI